MQVGKDGHYLSRWTDRPIQSSADDSLDRKEYARHIATLIESSHSYGDSTVVGLSGPWGSGKTSLLKMVEEVLESPDPSAAQQWKIAWFTPWATNDTTGLLNEFYASVSSALGQDATENARAALRKLARIAAPMSGMIPIVGSTVSDYLKIYANAQLSWDEVFHGVVEELMKLDVPILVIVDDIDRLQTEEVLALLKVIRLLGRFPGVTYLLAYDEETLRHSLAGAKVVATGEDRAAEDFIEKIVQYPLVVPPLSPAQILTRIDAGLDTVMEQARGIKPNKTRLRRLTDFYLTQLTTPRTIDRFLAQLRQQFGMLNAQEINDTDLTILTLLRTVFPGLYNELPRWRQVLTSGERIDVLDPRTEHDRGSIFRTVPLTSKADARDILYELFPNLVQSGNEGAEGFWAQSSSPKPGDIAHPEYFDRYFTMGISAHDIADQEVEDIVAECSTGEANLAQIISGFSPEKLALFFTKGRWLTGAFWQGPNYHHERLQLGQKLVLLLDQVLDIEPILMNPASALWSWTVDLFYQIVVGAPESTSPDEIVDVLSGAPSLAAQIEIAETALKVPRLRSERPFDTLPNAPEPGFFETDQSFAIVFDSLANIARREVFRHIMSREEGPYEFEAAKVLRFIYENDGLGKLSSLLEVELTKESITFRDIVARFVAAESYDSEGRVIQILTKFDKEAAHILGKLAPKNWPDPDAFLKVNQLDISWQSRSVFAEAYWHRENIAEGASRTID